MLQPQSGIELHELLQFELQLQLPFELFQNNTKNNIKNQSISSLPLQHLKKFPMETSLKICFLIAMLYTIQKQKMCYKR